MGLSAKRPSRGDEARQRILQEVTETATEKKKRLNAEIEESLYKRIKMKSVEDGRSISDITRDLWSEYLSK
jgi:TRAP-type C4-dicarboxylate transport system substrate-binding protein